VVPFAVDTGPAVPPELDDLLPLPSARRPDRPASSARGGKKGTAATSSAPGAPQPPPWDYGPPPSPAPADTGAEKAGADSAGPGDSQEVAAPPPVVRPSVEEARRKLTSDQARDSLAAMAMTLIAGTAWNVISARRRRYGWF
jgi:hypothetical protein